MKLVSGDLRVKELCFAQFGVEVRGVLIINNANITGSASAGAIVANIIAVKVFQSEKL